MSESKTFNKVLAKRLRAAREQAGLSQGQVANLLSYSRPTISEIEAGRRKVSAEELPVFSKIYGVSISWLTSSVDDQIDAPLDLAARKLSKLKKEDLELVIQLLTSLNTEENQ